MLKNLHSPENQLELFHLNQANPVLYGIVISFILPVFNET